MTARRAACEESTFETCVRYFVGIGTWIQSMQWSTDLFVQVERNGMTEYLICRCCSSLLLLFDPVCHLNCNVLHECELNRYTKCLNGQKTGAFFRLSRCYPSSW